MLHAIILYHKNPSLNSGDFFDHFFNLAQTTKSGEAKNIDE